MRRLPLIAILAQALLAACSSVSERGTLAELRHMQIEIREEQVEGGIDKALASYQRFLEETPDSALVPEAIRRLADLKVEREYGHLTGGSQAAGPAPTAAAPSREPLAAPEFAPLGQTAASPTAEPALGESEADFERRATDSPTPAVAPAQAEGLPAGPADLERAGPLEAIALYQKLLRDYPDYRRNDQVLYQMSRAYEELGRTEEAMEVMDRLVRSFPQSGYLDEVQFRRAEYFFTHRQFLDAEEAYGSIVQMGIGSNFYQLALYKLGWTFYKQELYEDALDRFIALLDTLVAEGYDFDQTENETERKRLDDTFRVISLSFSNLGGAEFVADYFNRQGPRSYEDGIYRNLAEYYFDKRRYADANATYASFIERNPFHRVSPLFQMRVIEINIAGAFPSLVISSKKEFAASYGLQAEYWKHFVPEERPEVLQFLKTNLTDLANHYHALYRNPAKAEEKPANFAEARNWYREFLRSFPAENESPVLNYQLADLLMENRSLVEAAVEYERTAYAYPRHAKSATAGYAAVYAYREQLGRLAEQQREPVRREVVRSSLKFAATYPEHEKAPVVLGAAADDLYGMQEYEQATAAGRWLIAGFPEAGDNVQRAAWLVVGHATFELQHFAEAEVAYQVVLGLLPEQDAARPALYDNLAAAVYQQGEAARASEDFAAAAEHFLRVARLAPASKIRPAAEYDAAGMLMQIKDWPRAAAVLEGFRKDFPVHELQPEVTKKIAYVYRQDGRLSLAAAEYERIERESGDDQVRSEALLLAAELYQEAGEPEHTREVYRRYVDSFPQPVDLNLETRNKLAELLKQAGEQQIYLDELRRIVAIEAAAGAAQTPRTRFLAAKAALVLAELSYERFVEVQLVNPIKQNLNKKRDRMKAATKAFTGLLAYEVGEVTAAATFYLAEIYAHFSKALMQSERPEGLEPLELEQYELAIEEQAYPFEEQAIVIHEKNLKLIAAGIYNPWVERSLAKLAVFVPARYARPEAGSGPVASLESFSFEIARPVPDEQPQTEIPATAAPADDQPVDPNGTPAPAPVVGNPGPIQEDAVQVENEPELSAPAKEPASGPVVEEEPGQALSLGPDGRPVEAARQP